jgi:hypothetical protein
VQSFLKKINIYQNAIFNNASVISWQSVFWVEEFEVPGENHLKLEYHSFLFILHYKKATFDRKSTRLKIDKLPDPDPTT